MICFLEAAVGRHLVGRVCLAVGSRPVHEAAHKRARLGEGLGAATAWKSAPPGIDVPALHAGEEIAPVRRVPQQRVRATTNSAHRHPPYRGGAVNNSYRRRFNRAYGGLLIRRTRHRTLSPGRVGTTPRAVRQAAPFWYYGFTSQGRRAVLRRLLFAGQRLEDRGRQDVAHC